MSSCSESEKQKSYRWACSFCLLSVTSGVDSSSTAATKRGRIMLRQEVTHSRLTLVSLTVAAETHGFHGDRFRCECSCALWLKKLRDRMCLTWHPPAVVPLFVLSHLISFFNSFCRVVFFLQICFWGALERYRTLCFYLFSINQNIFSQSNTRSSELIHRSAFLLISYH